MFYEKEMLCDNALDLFREAGHTFASRPIYSNHTLKQVLYSDSNKVVFVNRELLYSAGEISHLFNVNDSEFEKEDGLTISFYSAKLLCEVNHRSKTAEEIHSVLQSSFLSDYSIVIFQHEESVMLSVTGLDNDIILSDWYDLFFDAEQIIDLLSIANYSHSSVREYLLDYIYLFARPYYLDSGLTGVSAYSAVPTTYFDDIDDELCEEKPTVKEAALNSMVDYQKLYGDDYVAPMHGIIQDFSAIGDEIAKLSFDMEIKRLSGSESQEEESSNKKEKDEFEFDKVAPEVFEDPELLLKWLDNN